MIRGFFTFQSTPVCGGRPVRRVIFVSGQRVAALASGLHLVSFGLPRLAVRGTLAMIGLFGNAVRFCHKCLPLLELA
jgi:hypothetical protein